MQIGPVIIISVFGRIIKKGGPQFIMTFKIIRQHLQKVSMLRLVLLSNT